MDKKVCIVTGASGGIGIKIVRKFLEEGCFVVMTDLDAERLSLKAEENGLNGDSYRICTLDITKEEDVRETLSELYEEYGHFDL